MSIKCRIWYDVPLDCYIMTSTYDKKLEVFIEALKGFIPSGGRSYDPDKKFWYLKEERYAEFCRDLAQKTFGMNAVSFTSKTAAQQAQANQTSYANQQAFVRGSGPIAVAMSQFMELLPYEAARKAYLTACQMLHPDKNQGDATAHDKMARLNEVWTRIEKEVYKR